MLCPQCRNELPQDGVCQACGYSSLGSLQIKPTVFTIHPPGGEELLRFCENGDIYVRGEKVDSNQDTWKLMQQLLNAGGLTIGELMEESWYHAEAKGFHGKNKTFPEDIALFHSELSEALEEFRNGHELNEVYFHPGDLSLVKKPEGVPIELADILIRIADVSKTHGIDLEKALRMKLEYNKSRPYLHGGKSL